MKQIILGSDAKQKIKILYEDTTIEIEFRFYPTIESWNMNISFRDEELINGKKITMGVPMLKQLNKPFDLIALENQKTGIDPFKQDDFINRVNLYLLEREDLIEIRGYDVV